MGPTERERGKSLVNLKGRIMRLTAQRPSQLLIDLVGALEGSWSGWKAMCRCPAHGDATPSLSLRQGDRGILVHCFGGCDSADVLRELRRITPGQRYPFPENEDRPFDSAHLAKRIWSQGWEIAGTWAESYLAFRGITSPFDDLRFHPRCPKGRKPRTEFLPALLIGVRERREIKAVQRIFLKPEGQGYTAKVMIGNPCGASWQGQRPGKILALAEGFETAARFAQIHGVPSWSSLGAARLDLLTLPEGIEELLIAEDNDPEGHRAGEAAAEAYRRAGLRIRRVPPPLAFGDWAGVPRPG